MPTTFSQRLTVLLAGLTACDGAAVDASADPNDVRSLPGAEALKDCVLAPRTYDRAEDAFRVQASNWTVVVSEGADCESAESVQSVWTELPYRSSCDGFGRVLCLTGRATRTDTYAAPGDTGMQPPDVGTYCTYPALIAYDGTECGRPLRDEAGRAALPDVITTGARCPAVLAADLPDDVRRALAQRWLRDAQAEHASIASFAQLTLDLLAHGAPASLIARCAQAQADEVAHARTAFTLASMFLGHEVEPGPMAIPSLPTPSVAALAASTVRDGCVNEAMAAAEAVLRLAGATLEPVRAALTVVVEDEARHAVLARDIVSWAVALGGDEVAGAVLVAWADAQEQPPEVAVEPAVPGVGLCGSDALRALHARVLEAVVRPEVQAAAA